MGKTDVKQMQKEIEKIKIALNEKHPEAVSNTQFLISTVRGQQKFMGEIRGEADRIAQQAQAIQGQLIATKEFIKEKKLEEEYKTFMEEKAKKQAEEADKKRAEMEKKLDEQQKKIKEQEEKEKSGEE